jgi:hypothetical protein
MHRELRPILLVAAMAIAAEASAQSADTRLVARAHTVVNDRPAGVRINALV